MTEPLRRDALNILASEGVVLVEGPGVAATIDVVAASCLSDQLLAACGSARLQQRRAIFHSSKSEPS